MKTIFFGVLVLIFLVSCRNDDNPNIEYTVIEITDYEDINLADLVKSSDIIPLEMTPSSLLSANGKMWPSYKGYFYASGLFDNEEVYYFNEMGQFITVLGKRGIGPGEYPACFHLIDLDDTIAIYDHRKKYTLYLRDGSFVGDINLGSRQISAASIHPSNRDIYILTGTRKHQVYRLNRHTLAEVDSFLVNSSLNEYKSNSFYPVSQNRLFFQNRGKIRLDIYEITNTFEKRYYIETGTDPSQFKEDDAIKLMMSREPGLVRWTLRGFHENQDWVYLFLWSMSNSDPRKDFHHFLFDRRHQQVYRLPGHFHEKNEFGPAFRLDQTNTLHLTYNPDQMNDVPAWVDRCQKLNIPISLDQNTYVVKVSLDSLLKDIGSN